MRVAFISDLHANLVALDAVLEDAAAQGCERVICLGDIVDLGPQPGPTIARLREHKVACIAGNHDTLDEGPTIPLLRECEGWTRQILMPEERAWLGALPAECALEIGSRRVLGVHGSPRRIDEGIVTHSALDDVLAGVDADIVVCGHTHVQFLWRHRDTTVVNVGSVGQPFLEPVADDAPVVLPYADYAIVSPAGVELRRIEYDLDAFFETIRAHMPSPEAWIAQWRRPAPAPSA